MGGAMIDRNVGAHERLVEWEGKMIRLLTAGTRIWLVVAAMAVAVPMVTFAQTTEPAIESVPASDQPAVPNSSPTGDENSTDKDTSVQTEQPVAVEVEIQRRINELRSELLDDRASYIDRWLSVITIVLTFFSIVAVVLGYIGFRRFREIETEAKNSAETAKEHAAVAEKLVAKIKEKRDEGEKIIQNLNAQTAADNPEEAKQVVANVRENPKASLIDKAIANALDLQQQGERDDAITQWRAVARDAEGSDDDLAARAWFSVGYLLQDESPEEGISAYNRAISLAPDAAEAYNNRGNAKAVLKRYEAAIADHDQAILLNPGLAEAYSNRGTSKAELGRHDGAIADYDEAIRLKPDYAGAYINRGISKAALKRYEAAIADHDQAILLNPDLAEAYSNRGITKYALGRHDDAIADHDEAIRLKPDYAEAYSNRGISKAALKRYEAAIADHDQAIRLKPDFAAAYINRGEAKGGLKLKDEARKDIKTALVLARNTNNASLVAQAEQSLRDLDDAGGS